MNPTSRSLATNTFQESPSGKLTAIENGDLPLIYPWDMEIFRSFVSLPEGKPIPKKNAILRMWICDSSWLILGEILFFIAVH